MFIAVAQIPSKKGNVEINISTHLKAINKASELGVNYIVFPELSLTGYEPELAANLVFSEDDQRLHPLIESAIKNKITIGIGAPLRSNELPQIGLLIISQTGAVDSYAKMHLHPIEEKYFTKGSRYNLIDIGNTKIANAICADIANKKHASSCATFGADIYIAGVLITENGYEVDSELLSNYSKDFNMLVAIANHSQPSGGWIPIGKSAIWYKGNLLARAGESEMALVVAKQIDHVWSGQVIKI